MQVALQLSSALRRSPAACRTCDAMRNVGTFTDYSEFQHSDDLDLGVDSQPLLGDGGHAAELQPPSHAHGAGRGGGIVGGSSSGVNISINGGHDGLGGSIRGGRLWKAVSSLWEVRARGEAERGKGCATNHIRKLCAGLDASETCTARFRVASCRDA